MRTDWVQRVSMDLREAPGGGVLTTNDWECRKCTRGIAVGTVSQSSSPRPSRLRAYILEPSAADVVVLLVDLKLDVLQYAFGFICYRQSSCARADANHPQGALREKRLFGDAEAVEASFIVPFVSVTDIQSRLNTTISEGRNLTHVGHEHCSSRWELPLRWEVPDVQGPS